MTLSSRTWRIGSLRRHPIVMLRKQASIKVPKNENVYFRAGCPLLALEVFSKLPDFFYQEVPDLLVFHLAIQR